MARHTAGPSDGIEQTYASQAHKHKCVYACFWKSVTFFQRDQLALHGMPDSPRHFGLFVDRTIMMRAL